ncbi:MAG: glycoside hydrolase family 3 C-terminal domain-containing protein [Agathobacter sp.]|nr:glycoside hydrolase family 3 C-terminal domain-containing protein [Agathobacter sp.]
MKKGKRTIVNILMVIVCILTVVLNAIAPWGRDALDGYYGTYSVKTNQEKMTQYLKEGEEIAYDVQAEGTVLVQNNGLLPMNEKEISKVNVFGWASTNWLASGSGSAQTLAIQTDLLDALRAEGISYNTELAKMYEEFMAANPYKDALHNYAEKTCRLYEPSISDEKYYTKDMLANAKEFSDTALVVLGRYSGESIDCPRVQYKVTETSKGKYDEADVILDKSRTYLDISTEEENLLHYVTENYENVIVLVNNTNQMNLSFLAMIEGIDACLITGTTGIHAASAIPALLTGKINPSGRLADTYAYDFSTASTYINSGAEGEGMYTGAEGFYPADGVTTNPNVGDNPLYEGVSYVDYVEGIYVGYKWYETADAEGFWAEVDNQYGKGYEGVVQFPFGYGLSFTTFSQEIVETYPVMNSTQEEMMTSSDSGRFFLTKDGEVRITVKVTNTGDVAGKEVVQIYYTAPYTKGGIEKSYVELCGFAKTKLLKPGESETVTIAFDVEDMASYDCYDANQNGFKGYELEAGDYVIKVMKNAHELAGENTSVTFYNPMNIQYTTSSETGTEITNKFTGENAVDGVSLDGSDSEANITYLTRADFKGTFPSELAANREMTENLKDLNLYLEEDANAFVDDSDEDIVTGKENSLLLYDENGFTQLGLELGGDYNHAKWNDVLDQMSLEEMKTLVLHGYTKTMEVASVGKIQTKDYDGPAQMGGFANCIQGETTGFPNATVIAQTWNADLAYDFGRIEGAQAGELGIEGWYAPAANMHRTPFGGRNYEYYSEDEFISGRMAAKTVEGSLDAGTFCYMKHLICYEQDSMRDSLYTWMTEQALREIYLRPFQLAITEGGLSGIMTSYNRLGAVWAGGSKALMTSVVRDEFGFQGCIITDYSDHQNFMIMDQALRAGGDLWMDGFVMGDFTYETESNSFKQELRRACKNILYMWANAGYENAQYNADCISVDADEKQIIRPVETKQISLVTWIQLGWDIFAAVTIFFWVRGMIKRKKAVKAD